MMRIWSQVEDGRWRCPYCGEWYDADIHLMSHDTEHCYDAMLDAADSKRKGRIEDPRESEVE